LDIIGNTPLIKIGKIYAKAEFLNPGGSIKDRIAKYMVEDAEKKGLLKPGFTIVEPTSGNMGIALAMVAAVKGYGMIAVMPENASIERKQLIKAFGGEVVLTPEHKNLKAAIEKAEELCKKPGTFMPQQFKNPANIRAHRETTAKEIMADIDKIDAFVAGTGTGGTLMGVGLALREAFPNAKIVAVEPEESAVMSGGKAGSHSIEGIGDGFVPDLVDMGLIDEIITVKSDSAMKMAKHLARKHGLLVGISSGANVIAAKRLAKRYKNVVTVLPDRAERYLSKDLFR